MNIYFVNRYSKLKGPFDIIGSNRQQIIKVGDICLRDNVDGVAFLVVSGTSNSWNACKQIGIGEHDLLVGLGNNLLLSFDGLHKRKGDVALIKQLVNCYREKVIVEFFNNAIDILEYKKDFWDMSLFQRFFATSQDLITRSEVTKPSISENTRKYPSVFAKYLDEDLLDILERSLKDGYGLKEAYMILREKNSMQFRSALMKFLAENPNGTIYDKPLSYKIDNKSNVEANKDNSNSINEEIKHEFVLDEYQSFLIKKYDDKKFKDLLNHYKKGDRRAYNLLIKQNMELVAIMARSFHAIGVEQEDLIQEGSIGLIEAIMRFRPELNVRFPEYAKWWIRRIIINSLTNIQSVVRIPSKLIGIYKKTLKDIECYEQENEQIVSDIDIEIDNNTSSSNKISFYKLPQDLSELVVYTNHDETEADESLIPDYNLIHDSTIYDVYRLIHALSERERQFLVDYYGLNGKPQKSLEEIGSMFGLTRERVRQIVEKSIHKLRVFLKAVKDKDIEELSSLKVMESRWKRCRGNQFTSLDSAQLYTESKKNPIKVSRNTKERNKNHFREYINDISPQFGKNGVNIIPNLRRYILQVLKQSQCSMTSYEVYSEVARLLPSKAIRKESIEYLLREMPEVNCTSTGWYQIKNGSPIEPAKSIISKPLNINNSFRKEVNRDYEAFSLSTPLNELVKFKILTRKDYKLCRRKGLFTIGDVQKKIQEHNLTPESTRFTQYTIKMWFKIVGLLKSNTSQKDIEDKKDIASNNHIENLEDIYNNYTQKILKIRQAKIKGKIIIAKPALLLAVLNGIDEDIFSNNRILLNDWLVNRYNKLMSTYYNNTSFTEIGMPFWYMQSDGFWHLQFIGILKEKVYTPSIKWLNNNVEYAYFDDSLWLLLQDKEWRMRLRNFILEYKLSKIKSGTASLKIDNNVQNESRIEDSSYSLDDLEIEYVKIDSNGNVISTSSSANEKIYQSNRSGRSWTENEEKTLTYFFKQGRDVATLAKLLGRTEVAIKSRLGKLGLINYTYGQDKVEEDTE